MQNPAPLEPMVSRRLTITTLHFLYSLLLWNTKKNKGGSVFTKTIAVIVNALNCVMFSFALRILNEPQVYIGIVIFLIPAMIFLFELTVKKVKK